MKRSCIYCHHHTQAGNGYLSCSKPVLGEARDNMARRVVGEYPERFWMLSLIGVCANFKLKKY